MKIEYDALVLAVGSEPVHPPIEGMNKFRDSVLYSFN